MKLIVGLGNPGIKYQFTRHNIGFLAVKRLAKGTKIKFDQRKFNSRFAQGRLVKNKVLLVTPYTYMNLSGKAVLAFLNWAKLNLEDLLVVCDDVNLKFATMRIKPQGSSGGHNGLKSVIDSLGSGNFSRLRLGIGSARPVREEFSNGVYPGEKDLEKYVLGQFTLTQRKLIDQFLERAVEASRTWVSRGIEEAMCRFNLRCPQG